MVVAARSTVYRWVRWSREGAIEGLRRAGGGRRPVSVTEKLFAALERLLDTSPQALGYVRTTWSSELLSVALGEHYDIEIHPSTVLRALRRTEFRWRRARPTRHQRDPNKAEKLAAIPQAVESSDSYTEVFFVDEADVDLNPRIGFT
jgi:transposase